MGRLRMRRATISRKTAGVPIPKFANTGGTLSCELRNQGDTSNSMILVPPFEPEVRNRTLGHGCANFGFGAREARSRPADARHDIVTNPGMSHREPVWPPPRRACRAQWQIST